MYIEAAAGGGPSQVQAAVNATNSGTTDDTLTISLGSNVSSGSELIVACTSLGDDAVTFQTVTDDCAATSSAWVNHASGGSGTRGTVIASATTSGTGACTVTVDSDATTGIGIRCVLMEWENVSTATILNSSLAGFSSTPNVTDMSPTGSDVLYVGVVNYSGGSTTITPGSGWTEVFEQEDPSSVCAISVEYLVQTGTADAPDWTLGASRSYAASGTTFEP